MAAIPNKKASKKGSYHHGDLRRALIEAALSLIAKQGISALTLREVSKQVGVSRMAPYRHFTDKADLLAAVAEEGFRALNDVLVQAAQRHSEPIKQLQAIGVAYVGYAVSHAAHYRVMFGSGNTDKQSYPALSQIAAETFVVLVQTLTVCQQSGVVRSGEPRQQAQIAWSLVHGLSMLVIDGQLIRVDASTLEALSMAATSTLIEGLKA